jgi:outer membrane receptor protein involved in Fe transport
MIRFKRDGGPVGVTCCAGDSPAGVAAGGRNARNTRLRFPMSNRDRAGRTAGVGKRHLCVAFLLLFLVPALVGNAQTNSDNGEVAGLVIETWGGKPLSGVTITLRGTTLATTTDAQGRYTLKPVPPGDHIMRFSKSGYAAAVVSEVRVLAGQTTKVDGNLRPEYFEMEEYEVTADLFQEQTAMILKDRSDSAALMDAIGSEEFSRLGAGDAAEIMTKVTGVTVADGKFAVIRGLSDRYTSIMLNGAEVPSADPYRRAVQLDLFPSDMIDRIVVSKTFTPDMPGGFAGGAANIISKSYPEKFLFKLGAGVGFNTQSTFNDRFATYDGGGTDWLALDDGSRELPSIVSEMPANQIPRPPFTPESAALMREINLAFQGRQFAPVSDAAPMNQDFSLSLGDTRKVFGRRLGFFAGVNQAREFSFYEDGRRATYEGGVDFDTFQFGLVPRLDLRDVSGVETANWGGVASVAYELSDEHDVGFTYLRNQTAGKMARRLTGYENRVSEEWQGGYFDTSVLSWTERELSAYQFRGHHEFPSFLRSESDWLVSVAGTGQEEPDLRYFSFYARPLGNGTTLYDFSNNIQPTFPTRYFRDLSEESVSFRFDETVPFDVWRDLEAKAKGGYFLNRSDRAYEERSFQYQSGNSFGPFTSDGDPNGFLTDANLAGNSKGQFDRYVANYPVNFDYNGQIDVTGWYGMLEVPVRDTVRLIGGARLEHTDLGVLTLNKNNGTRSRAGIDQSDVLPALSLVWNFVTNMNVRASVSQTIARPTYREISPSVTFDFVGADQLVGNPNLRISQVRNYDLRWEWFPRPGEVISASLFYKQIDAPIEKTLLGTDSRITYVNSKAATLMGAELEARKKLDFVSEHLEDFSLGFNFAYIQSEVPRTSLELANRARYLFPASATRPLFDQSPYIANLDTTWSNDRLGTSATLVFGYSAERLAFVNLDTPDIYEQPAPQLDLILSQQLGKGWKAKFSAKNLLDPEIKRTYDFDSGGSEVIYSSYKRGMGFNLGVTFQY